MGTTVRSCCVLGDHVDRDNAIILPAAFRSRHDRACGRWRGPGRRGGRISYTVDGPGLRAHLSQINAAIGLVQLRHIDEVASARRILWTQYKQGLKDLPGADLIDVGVSTSVP
ncbi:DegT/DnrJ/EryC1/StrS family aminotransferase [Streptomyces sp. NPDC058385]|uniref:DegT/DnrJ/EryC1/StrS family aminotransferase n=1 Tax=Streptomyces sp. NPDC058385 TaxID=3346473 RepID=UPI003656FBBD